MLHGLHLRPEEPSDRAAIFDLTRRAFAGKPYASGDEPALVDALRDAGALSLSLVATLGERIVGHVAFSPAVGAAGWFALGPISVDPEFQRRGIGGELIRAGLGRLHGAMGCILIGDTQYYPRHGFVPRPDLCPAGEPAEYFMAIKLDPETPDAILGFHPVLHATPEGRG